MMLLKRMAKRQKPDEEVEKQRAQELQQKEAEVQQKLHELEQQEKEMDKKEAEFMERELELQQKHLEVQQKQQELQQLQDIMETPELEPEEEEAAPRRGGLLSLFFSNYPGVDPSNAFTAQVHPTPSSPLFSERQDHMAEKKYFISRTAAHHCPT